MKFLLCISAKIPATYMLLALSQSCVRLRRIAIARLVRPVSRLMGCVRVACFRPATPSRATRIAQDRLCRQGPPWEAVSDCEAAGESLGRDRRGFGAATSRQDDADRGRTC